MASAKRRKLRLGGRASVSELAAAALSEATGALQAQLPALLGQMRPKDDRAGVPEAEAVHRARVSLRKLRTYVRLFRSRIGHARVVRMAKELRWAFRLLGELRDRQVFAQNARQQAGSEDPPTAAWHARLAALIQAPSQRLRTPAAARRFHTLLAQLEAAAQALSERRDDEHARPWLGAHLKRQRKRLRAKKELVLHAHERTPTQATQAELHALRKRAKKLRYTSDLMRALGTAHKKRERRFRKALAALQTTLGALNDARVARELLALSRPPAALRARLREINDATLVAHLAELPDVFACFSAAQRFWD